jgi:outer membrane protein OmpA-like peptidoglycan-associated protein
MTLSLLQHLRETQGAALVSETTQKLGLSPDKATGFINAALALVLGRLVTINKTEGTSKVLDIIDSNDTAALWQNAEFTQAYNELRTLGGVDDATSLQALNLVASHSLNAILDLDKTASLGKEGINELLEGQEEHLQGHFPDWIYAAAGLPALIGATALSTVKEGVASLGSLLRQAGDAIAETATEVAHKATDAATTALGGVTDSTASLSEKASGIVSNVSDKASEAISSAGVKAAIVAGTVGDKATEVLGNVTAQASEAAANLKDKATTVAANLGDSASHAVSGATDAAAELAAKTTAATAAAAAAATAAVAATTAAAADKLHAAGDLLHKTAHNASDRVNHAASSVNRVVAQPPSFFVRFLPWLALLALALIVLFFWRRCATEPVPVAPAAVVAAKPAAALIPALLSLSTSANGELVTCSGTVGNADLLENFTKAIQAQFGPAAKCDIKINAAYDTSFAGLAGLSESLGAIKGVPNSSFDLNGNTVTVNGPDATANSGLVDRLKALFGTGVAVSAAAALDANAAVTNGVNAASNALGSIDASKAKPEDVANALNLQVINFATGSDALPEENKAVLDKAVALIKAIPSLKLAVTGHTDSSGNEKSNQALSERRAKSVVAYLVSKGVDAGSLSAKGVGSAESIADNATDQGKFKNRRISFAVATSGS